MSVIKPILQQPDQIAYFAGANNYCWTHFRGGDKKLLAKPISYIEVRLPGFIRIHKTILVNPIYVRRLYQPPRKKMTGKVYLDNGDVLPVSRRRWDQVVKSLQNYAVAGIGNDQPAATDATTSAVPAVRKSLLSVYLVTTCEISRALTRQVLEKHWPAYQFFVKEQSTFLPHMLESLPERERPALILLDARTATAERLNTLDRLKESAKLRSIPIVLFVSPTTQAVIDAYQHQANSVISMPVGYALFDTVIERTCRFWLRAVKLPMAESATGQTDEFSTKTA